MIKFLPNMHPLTFTTSAVIVAYLLIDDLSINEQAAMGAWFNVIGDILACSSAWSSVLEDRYSEVNEDDDLNLLKDSLEKILKILEENNIK